MAGPGQSILEGPREGESSSGGRGSGSRRDAPGSGSREAAVEIEVVQAQSHSEASTSSSQVGGSDLSVGTWGWLIIVRLGWLHGCRCRDTAALHQAWRQASSCTQAATALTQG